jgi:hypothetical protein
VLIIGRMLHNWDLATKRMLLKKPCEALPKANAMSAPDFHGSATASDLLVSVPALHGEKIVR